jgi:hypothetical protein
VSYAPLNRIRVRAGRSIAAGAPLGIAAVGRHRAAAGHYRSLSAGLLHFGVRREGERFGYVDPLQFLAVRRAAPPPVVAVRARPPRSGPRPRARPVRLTPALAPWPVWLGLVLGLSGLIGAGRLRSPFRRLGGAPCRASSTSSSSPTTPSSP